MSGSKIVFVILVLVAVLFAVAMFLHPSGSNETVDTFASEDHPTLASMNNVVAPFAPKLQTNGLMPAVGTFDLSRLASYKVTVLPDQAHTFRVAQFAAFPTKTCALVVYTPADSSGFDKGQKQDGDHAGSKANPQAFSFTISSAGGTLSVARRSPLQTTPCTISLNPGK